MKFQIDDMVKIILDDEDWNGIIVKIVRMTDRFAVCQYNGFNLELGYNEIVKLTKLERSLL